MLKSFLEQLLGFLRGMKQKRAAPVTASRVPPPAPGGDYELTTGLFSDPGCVRKRNEDSIALLKPITGQGPAQSLLAIVADGMGGHQAGDRASQLAVDIIRQSFAASDAPPEQALAAAFQAANLAILNEASHDAALTGMGTTATTLAIANARAWLAHVGDSRLYRLRNGQLEQLSEDHTLVAAMVRDRLITPEQAKEHPNRHVLSRAMGTHQRLEVMLAPVDLALGDVFLLCSDGLHDLVEPGEIRECLLTRPPQASCAFLVELARSRGGYDNISIIAVQCGKPHDMTPQFPTTRDVVQQCHD